MRAAELWDRVDKDGHGGCWIVRGARADGYVRISIDGVLVYAHRYVWEQTHGPVPAGLVLDHLCRNRACCNDAHLEPVTRRENNVRGMHPLALLHRANRCVRGHSLADAYVAKSGKRRCRICTLASNRRYTQGA